MTAEQLIKQIDEITHPKNMTPQQALAFMELVFRATDVRVAALRGTVEKER